MNGELERRALVRDHVDAGGEVLLWLDAGELIVQLVPLERPNGANHSEPLQALPARTTRSSPAKAPGLPVSVVAGEPTACLECGKTFVPKRKGTRFCRIQCTWKHTNRLSRQRKREAKAAAAASRESNG